MGQAWLGDPENETEAPVAPAQAVATSVVERPRRGLTITKLSRDAGYWTARVTVNNGAIVACDVDRRYGSWHAVKVDETTGNEIRREVLPYIAAALQDKVRPIEAAERRQTGDKK